VAAGRVRVGGAPAAKAAHLVGPGQALEVVGPGPRFVGRGGEKLDAALDRFAVPVSGRRALDAGASTGGFTDCLLQRGARAVVAVDVGYGQLHERLRSDPRVEVRERTNVRSLDRDALGGPVDLVVADLSFISLRTVVPVLVPLVDPAGDLVLLVKPQFEAGRQEASRGAGVIRDPAVWRRVLLEVAAVVGAQGADRMGVMPSPLTGADGNVEFLLHARRGTGAPGGGALDVDGAVTEALDRDAGGS
jgi:23S rRNA (cytidine1920-2'-O)/16S rRNA (cytidine1409-2'-O)-methyltransferase